MFHDISWKQKIHNLATFLPLNLIGRTQERLQVARIINTLLLTTDPKRLLSIQVDAVYVQVPKTEAKKIEHTFKKLKYCDLNNIASPIARSLTNVRSPNNESKELVYKCNPSQPRFPGGTLSISQHVAPPNIEPLEWTTHIEPKEGPDDFLEKVVLKHVEAGKGFTCLGAPGVGKTWILGKVKEKLEQLDQKVVCLAPTHCAARLLPDGDTVHHFVGKYAMQGAFKGWILLDEISMCGLPLLAALDNLRQNGTKVCTFGDWSQLPAHPESCSWRGTSVSATAFQESRLYKSWSDCTCFELTRCRRSDEAHFLAYTSLPQNLSKAISQSRKRYMPIDDADLHITISHRKRRAIATFKQAKQAIGKECISIPAGDDPSFDCFVGTKLVGSSTTANKVVNGGRYIVTAIGEQIRLKDQMTDDEFDVTPEFISKHCLLAHSMVYNKVQGCTESGSVMLHNTASPYFKRCHLYVGLSRVTDGALAFISQD